MPDFATPEDIRAARPDLDIKTIQRHCRSGKLPARKVGRSWLIEPGDAEAYVREYVRNARPAKKTEAETEETASAGAPQSARGFLTLIRGDGK